MRQFILFVPTFIISVFVFSQKNTNKGNQDKNDIIIKTDLQKFLGQLTAKLPVEPASSAGFIATMYKNIGLPPFDSSGYTQAFTLNLGKEIKPATTVKINDIKLETGTDYWPFAFCPNGYFAGTAVWGSAAAQQFFLYDLKTDLEKNKKYSVSDLLKHIKEKVAELASNKISAVIVYNTSEINDSLIFSAKDTNGLTAIPVIYFTKAGIQKLTNESAISNTIEAKIETGEKIIKGTNAAAYLNNNAANTVIITASQNNVIETAVALEIAKLLKELSKPDKKNNVLFNMADYANNNYLFMHVNDNSIENYGCNYFLQHLPEAIKINYGIKIGISGASNDTINFLSIGEEQSSSAWKTILQHFDPLFNSKIDSSIFYFLGNTAFYKNNIPLIYLYNPLPEITTINKTTNLNKNDIKTIHYIMQLIGSANNVGKLPFNKNDK